MGDLIHIERNQIHRGMMMRSVPAVAFQKPIDDVVRVGVFPVNGGDRGEFQGVDIIKQEPVARSQKGNAV